MKYIVTMEMKEDIEPFMPYRQKKIKYIKNSTKNKSTKKWYTRELFCRGGGISW